MPEGLEQNITPQDLANLIAYLNSAPHPVGAATAQQAAAAKKRFLAGGSNGVARVLAAGAQGPYQSWMGELPLASCRQTQGQSRLSWESPAPPSDLKPADVHEFRLPVSMGHRPGDPPGKFSLRLNGQPVLDFDVALHDQSWHSADGNVRMSYLVMEDNVQESNGILTISASGSLLEPNKPATFEVIGPAARSRRWFGIYLLGFAQELFNGKDLTGWRKPTGDWTAAKAVSLDATDPEKFVITPGEGILVNGAKERSVNLISELEFGDAQAHVEFWIPQHSNSGVYLMGRYEIQIYDVEKAKYPGMECGGIYGRAAGDQTVEGHSPRVNASKPPGEWQTFDITFRAPRFDSAGKKIENAKMVKVVHNGQIIHENVELNGPTRSAMSLQEKPAGPIMLQGNHGPVAFRNLRIEAID
jgi:hypothetical protein